ncbi:DUF4215 domain-containing protein [Patescibacteria group bacterium]|nr:MAG: DUF4215 domain-containing protein [Patescibacteria group bacterium]
MKRQRLLGLAAILCGALLLGAAFASPVLAQVNTGLTPDVEGALGLGTTDVRVTVARIIRNFMGLLGIVAVLLILYGGFLWMTAAGNEEQVDKARKVIISAVIGLAIVLSSYAIAQFVMNSLLDATGATPGAGGGGGGGGGGFGGGGASSDSFVVRGFSPTGSVPIRNVTARAIFNQNVDAGSVAGNVRVTTAAGAPVDGTYAANGSAVEFVPAAACPPPNESRRCFDADADYHIEVTTGLRSSSGRNLTCAGLSSSGCSADFRTGSIVDVAAPSLAEVVFPDDGQSVIEGDLIPVQVHAVDDAGISSIDVTIDGGSIGRTVPAALSPDFTGTVDWDTTGVTVGTHSIGGTAFDLDDNSVSVSGVSVAVRPRHCGSGVQDGDETGVDCGGSCGACGGGSCGGPADCAGGVCRSGTCVDVPMIESVSPTDGGPGTLVSVAGRAFGGSGQVTFLGGPGADDDVTAALCDGGARTDREITVTVPAGAVTGPIRVSAAGGEQDDTDDARGPNLLGVFTVNATTRPGICRIEPSSGRTGDGFTLTGAGFGEDPGTDGSVLFAVGGRDSAAGTSDADWSPTEIRGRVPSLAVTVETDGTVRVRVGTNESNRKSFRALSPEAGTLPNVTAIEPSSGPVSEYVTLRGSNFGARVGRVLFQLPDGTTADGAVDFPAICAERYWTDAAVTVKVPAFYRGDAGGRTPISLAAHNIRLERADGAQSNTVNFTVTDGVPHPGLCAIDPDNGPADTRVRLLGERFGSTSGEVTFFDGQASTVDGPWADTEIQNARVPFAAATGPVSVEALGGVISNSLPFTVGQCRDDASCTAGTSCCADGSCRADCTVRTPTGAFVWRFSTGDVPVLPRVVEQATCETDTQSPSPYRGSRDACANAIISARFTAEMDPASFPTNVAVEACGQGDGFDSGACTGTPLRGRVEVLRESVVVGATARYTSRMTFTPEAAFASSTWYRVTLAAGDVGIRSVEGIALDGDRDDAPGGDYVWPYRIRPNDEACGVDHVEVSPAVFTATGEGEAVDYRADPTAANCNLLMCTAYDWRWSHALADGSDASTRATLADDAADPVEPNSCRYVATALNETETDNPVHVRAEIPAAGKSDVGVLDINYLDPRVGEHTPMCSAACVNARVAASFNVAMDPATINARTVRLFTCVNESCRAFLEAGGVPDFSVEGTVDADGRTTGFQIRPSGAAQLARSSWYRVIVSGGDDGVRSRSGAPLADGNYGDDYSWTFRTKDDSALCDVASVSVSPPNASVQIIGDVAHYIVIPRGLPDDCDAGGQPLDGGRYSWDWTSANAAVSAAVGGAVGTVDFRSTPGSGTEGKDLLPLAGGESCSNACLLTGSVGSVSVCGNGRTERGEDCDDGGTTGGDSCSAVCLNEGTSAPACGNGTRTAGEDCDDGNVLNGDGCTERCTHEGSAGGGATCGNGDVGEGEDCDDGNTASGDGCSASCINEGTLPGPFSVCGNGRLESGEVCDDGNVRSGDGCSERCLAEGNRTACTPGAGGPAAGCCGNGILEPARFESCDDGNPDAGDGCSERCTLEGSNPRYGYSFTSAAYCGTNVPVETGEQCEFGGPTDGRPDPDSYVRGAAGGTADLTVATRNAAGDTVTGTAGFQMVCSCTVDNDCATLAPGARAGSIGCGNGGCCAPRPQLVPPFTPEGADVCRNTLMAATFNMRMDAGSFIGNVLLLERTVGPCAAGRGAGVAGFCVSSSTVLIADLQKTVAGGGLVTELQVSPREALAPSTEFRVLVKGDPDLTDAEKTGVRSIDGVPMSGDASWSFTTGTEICRLDQVRVIPQSSLFSTAQNDPRDDAPGASFDTLDDSDKVFRSQGVSRRGARVVPIVPVATYSWVWDWASSDGDRDGDPAPIHFTYPSSSSEAMTLRTIGQPQNGQATITAQATVTANIFGAACDPTGDITAQELACGRGRRCAAAGSATAGHCYGETASGSALATVLLCENPWPSRAADGTWTPFTDDDFNFSTYFCRDAGEAGRHDDLPSPADAAVSIGAGAAPGSALLGIIGDKLLPLQCTGASDLCQPGDAFGIRILRNRAHDEPARWYAKQGFTGSPVPVEVDGYDAVQDGRSVYINAGNKFGDPQLYTNVYLMSYNEGANETTQTIFRQMMENLRFNTNLAGDNARTCSVNVCSDDAGRACVTDGDCGTGATCGPLSCQQDAECGAVGGTCRAPKDKFTRDVLRLQDLAEVGAKMETAYGLASVCEDRPETTCIRDADCGAGDRCIGSYPTLASGSYIRGLSTSRWPSWQSGLGNVLGGALPQDPLNTFNTASAEGAACSTAEGYEAETCWNASAQTYQCPAGSRIYEYRKRGRGFEFGAEFELRFCSTDPNRLCSQDADCTGGTCRVLNWADPVEPVSHPETGILNVFRLQDVCQARATDEGLLSASDGVCGDGSIGPGEQCEIGDTGVEACTIAGGAGGMRWTCSDTCTKTYGSCAPARCGDGILSPPEACDDGSLNNTYGRCNGLCTGLGPHCGDGNRQAGEVCDLGGRCAGSGATCNFGGAGGCADGSACLGTTRYNASRAASCAPDCRNFGPYCGDGEISYGEICEPGQTESEVCGTDPDGREMRRSRTCVAACTGFGAWSACSVVSSCGDGVVQREAGEECDDGNRNQNDGCLNTCVRNVCGDRIVNPAGEECDSGADNIDASNPSSIARARASCAYGRSCNFCTNVCRGISVSGGYCGNGVVERPYELCEPNDVSCVEGATRDTHCSGDCRQACPPTFSQLEIRLQPHSPGGFISDRTLGEAVVDSGAVTHDLVIPACQTGASTIDTDMQIVADLTPVGTVGRRTSVLLVFDVSRSMGLLPNGTGGTPSRFDIAKNVVAGADGVIDQIYNSFPGSVTDLKMGILAFGGLNANPSGPILYQGSRYEGNVRTLTALTGAPELVVLNAIGREELKTTVQGLRMITSGSGRDVSPGKAAMERATAILDADGAEQRIVILVSDGLQSDDHFFSRGSSCAPEGCENHERTHSTPVGAVGPRYRNFTLRVAEDETYLSEFGSVQEMCAAGRFSMIDDWYGCIRAMESIAPSANRFVATTLDASVDIGSAIGTAVTSAVVAGTITVGPPVGATAPVSTGPITIRRSATVPLGSITCSRTPQLLPLRIDAGAGVQIRVSAVRFNACPLVYGDPPPPPPGGFACVPSRSPAAPADPTDGDGVVVDEEGGAVGVPPGGSPPGGSGGGTCDDPARTCVDGRCRLDARPCPIPDTGGGGCSDLEDVVVSGGSCTCARLEPSYPACRTSASGGGFIRCSVSCRAGFICVADSCIPSGSSPVPGGGFGGGFFP